MEWPVYESKLLFGIQVISSDRVVEVCTPRLASLEVGSCTTLYIEAQLLLE